MKLSQKHQHCWRSTLRVTAMPMFIGFCAPGMNKLGTEHGVAGGG